jgi:prepilin-type N-terminal cleavage/methylation domain-containing protein
MMGKNRYSSISRRGFTLLEVMIAGVLFSICTAMAVAGFSQVINSAVGSVKCAVTHRGLRYAMTLMSRDVMEAEQVYDYGSGEFLILRKPTDTGYVYIYYLVSYNKLYRFQSNTSGSEVLGDNFDYLTVKYFDLNGQPITSWGSAMIVDIKLGGKTTNRSNVYTDQVETRVRLRNKQV